MRRNWTVDRTVVARNIEHALAMRDRSRRELAELVQEHFRAKRGKVPTGATYGTIRSYAAGETNNPRRYILEAIAEVLVVRPEWLIWDEGEPTEEAERIRRAAAQIEPDEDDLEGKIRYRVDAVFPEFPLLPDDVQALVFSAIIRFRNALPEDGLAPDAEGIDQDALNIFLIGLQQAVMGPLRMFADASGEPADMNKSRVQDYLRSAVSAFISAIPERIERRPRHHFSTVKDGEGRTYRVSLADDPD